MKGLQDKTFLLKSRYQRKLLCSCISRQVKLELKQIPRYKPGHLITEYNCFSNLFCLLWTFHTFQCLCVWSLVDQNLSDRQTRAQIYGCITQLEHEMYPDNSQLDKNPSKASFMWKMNCSDCDKSCYNNRIKYPNYCSSSLYCKNLWIKNKLLRLERFSLFSLFRLSQINVRLFSKLFD